MDRGSCCGIWKCDDMQRPCRIWMHGFSETPAEQSLSSPMPVTTRYLTVPLRLSLCVAQRETSRPAESRVNPLSEPCISGGLINSYAHKTRRRRVPRQCQLQLLLSAPCPAGCRYPSWFLSPPDPSFVVLYTAGVVKQTFRAWKLAGFGDGGVTAFEGIR
jgi:hypothetical protein